MLTASQGTLNLFYSPFNQHSTVHNTSVNTSNNSEKLQLCIDYWIEDKDTKQNTKETLKTIEFIPLKQHIKVLSQCLNDHIKWPILDGHECTCQKRWTQQITR